MRTVSVINEHYYEVWGKVIFSQACVKNSVHRGTCAWSRGVHCSRRGRVPGGDTPPRPLLRVVRILLKCILVFYYFYSHQWFKESSFTYKNCKDSLRSVSFLPFCFATYFHITFYAHHIFPFV